DATPPVGLGAAIAAAAGAAGSRGGRAGRVCAALDRHQRAPARVACQRAARGDPLSGHDCVAAARLSAPGRPELSVSDTCQQAAASAR
ncbi:hypothetical protein ABTL01_20100, partial [Acinetobacter baumannii]